MIIYIAQKFTPSPVTLRKPAALPKCSTVRVPGRDRAKTVCLAERGSVYGDWPVYEGGAVDTRSFWKSMMRAGSVSSLR